MLISDIRKDTVVVGRSGRNKLSIGGGWIWYQTSGARSICTNIILGVECMGKGVTTIALRCKCTSSLIGLEPDELRAFEEALSSRILHHVMLFDDR
jgi:hypothetical protein